MSSAHIGKSVQLKSDELALGLIINYNVDGYENFTVLMDKTRHIIQVAPSEIAGIFPRTRAVCDCEAPHFIDERYSCRGLDGVGATGIYGVNHGDN